MPTMPCGAPVQCFVRSSARRSFIDHTLKYGSCVTKGTAGGLNVEAVWAADTTTAASSNNPAAGKRTNVEPFVRLIEEERKAFLVPLSRDCLTARLVELVGEHGEQDDGAERDALHVRVNAGEVQAVVEHADEDRAPQRRDHAPAPAVQRGGADDYRRDTVKLVMVT